MIIPCVIKLRNTKQKIALVLGFASLVEITQFIFERPIKKAKIN